MSSLSGDTQQTTVFREDIQLLPFTPSVSQDPEDGESDPGIEPELRNSRTLPDFRDRQTTSALNLLALGQRIWNAMSRSPLLRATRSQEIRLYNTLSIQDLRSTSRARNRGKGGRANSSQATSYSAGEARRGSFLQSTSATGIEVPAGHADNLFDDITPVPEDGDHERDASVELEEEQAGWNDRNPPDNSPFVSILHQSPLLV